MMNGMSLHPYPKGAPVGRQISMSFDGQPEELIERVIPKDRGETIDTLSPGAASLRRMIRQCHEPCHAMGGTPRDLVQATLPTEVDLS